MDFYATSFRGGSRLDTLIGLADAAGIPADAAEWDWSAGDLIFTPMTLPWWNACCDYLVTLASATRIAEVLTELGMLHDDTNAMAYAGAARNLLSDPGACGHGCP
jgi:hypothetical protein